MAFDGRKSRVPLNKRFGNQESVHTIPNKLDLLTEDPFYVVKGKVFPSDRKKTGSLNLSTIQPDPNNLIRPIRHNQFIRGKRRHRIHNIEVEDIMSYPINQRLPFHDIDANGQKIYGISPLKLINFPPGITLKSARRLPFELLDDTRDEIPMTHPKPLPPKTILV